MLVHLGLLLLMAIDESSGGSYIERSHVSGSHMHMPGSNVSGLHANYDYID